MGTSFQPLVRPAVDSDCVYKQFEQLIKLNRELTHLEGGAGFDEKLQWTAVSWSCDSCYLIDCSYSKDFGDRSVYRGV